MRVYHLLTRDLGILFSEKKTLAVILMMPIILTTILSFALSGAFNDNPEIPEFRIAVVKSFETKEASDQLDEVLKENGLESVLSEDILKGMFDSAQKADMERIFFEAFLEDPQVKEILDYEVVSMEEALIGLENDVLSAVVVLPENFQHAGYTNLFTTAQQKLEIEVIRNPNKSITADITVSMIQTFLSRLESTAAKKNAALDLFLSTGVSLDDKQIMQSLTQSGASSLTADIQYTDIVGAGRRVIDSKSYYSVGMLTLFLLFGAGRGSYMLLQEKRDFTYQRMLCAGIGKWDVLTGKFLTIFFMVFIQLCLLILFSTFVLGVEWGAYTSVLILSLFTAFAVAGLGILLAAVTFVSDKTRIASLFESVIFQIMGLLGGAYIPLEVLPEEMRLLSKIPLNGVALDGYLKIMSGSPVAEISSNMLLLTVNGLVLSGVAIYLVRSKEAKKHDGNHQAQASRA